MTVGPYGFSLPLSHLDDFFDTIVNDFIRCFSVIQQEKGKLELNSGIENFDTAKLKHAEMHEKNPLPTKEVIDQEKSA